MTALAELLAQALALHRAGRLDAAAVQYEAVLRLEPRQFDALHMLGVVAHQQGRLDAALAWFDRAAAGHGSIAALHANRGAALRDAGRSAEALASLDEALRLDPRHAKALANRAAARLDLGQAAAALADVDAALALDAQDLPARFNRASALKALGRRAEAFEAFTALSSALDALAALHLHLGELLRDAGRAAEALQRFERAVALDLRSAAAWVDHGHALVDLGRHGDAARSYQRALDLDAELPGLLGHWLHAKLRTCDWDGLDAALARLAGAIDASRAVCEPFVALFTPLDACRQRRCAELHVQRWWPASRPAMAAPSRAATDGRLRIGYLSADFHQHATAQLVAGVLERHDRSRFEITALAVGPAIEDTMRARLRAGIEHFIDVQALADETIAARARERGLQIVVDLGGATRAARPGVLAQRAAPLQLAWLGFPGTSGAPFIDYAIADAQVLPPGLDAEFSEAVVRLPRCYQANDDRRPLAPRSPGRAELGLPDDGFVFCCFNQAAKITPEVFGVWMELLWARPGSVLWLLHPGDDAAARLRAVAASRGIDAARLVFAPRLAPPQHLARHAAADLFVDTWPCNAHTTGSDALWAGLPVLTRRGDTFAGRVGASLLHAAGLPELVAPSTDAYRSLALALSHDRAWLAELRARLAATRSSCALFDTAGFTRSLEAAYEAIWRRHADGLPPASLDIA